jgi:hypothetical protein
MDLIDQDEITATSSWINYHRKAVFTPFVFDKNKISWSLRSGLRPGAANRVRSGHLSEGWPEVDQGAS